jgi:AAA+ ATPase superfamily predicted ATPase
LTYVTRSLCLWIGGLAVLVNPGGLIGPDEVVGRDELIERIWRRLERQSVVLTSERRTGKTSILNKMRMEVAPGFVVLTEHSDIEGLHSPLEFVERVYRDAERHLRPYQRSSAFRRAFTKLAGFELAGVIKFPGVLGSDWKHLLEALLDDLASIQGERLVFLWDEMPVCSSTTCGCGSATPRRLASWMCCVRCASGTAASA